MSDRKVYERSATYRNVYFKYNKGIFHKWYLCAYCRKKFIQKDIVEVDHIVAVNIMKHSMMFRILFGMLGKDVNDTMNLVGACRKCNRKKSDKGGKWIIRGSTGAIIHRVLQDTSIMIENVLKKFWYVVLLLVFVGLLGMMFLFWSSGMS